MRLKTKLVLAITALVFLELLGEAGVPASQFVKPFQRYAASGEINTTVADPAATVRKLAEIATKRGDDVDLLDGLTVDHGTWWFNVRPSNTEPLLRLNLEAPTPTECESRVAEVVAMISAAQES